jgi:fructosamine-3-kinase
MHRRNIHYWKCDRDAAFHGTSPSNAAHDIQPILQSLLARHFDFSNLTLTPAAGQGIHLTWTADLDGTPIFIRVAHGPETHSQLEVESALLSELTQRNIPVPKVIAFDDSRQTVPFGWQALQRIAHPDLNHWLKLGQLDHQKIPFQIGQSIARWQSFQPSGFGILELSPQNHLHGGHPSYPDYFNLHLNRHLDFLQSHRFINHSLAERILRSTQEAEPLLHLETGVLVHKDLALWNILGSPHQVAAFIDFEDAIVGDPTEDLALLACFHPSEFVNHAIRGFETIKPLPSAFLPRFWIHLLRNMIVKAVIRTGAGYFNRTDSFFLINRGNSGSDLQSITQSKLLSALHGFENQLEINTQSLP